MLNDIVRFPVYVKGLDLSDKFSESFIERGSMLSHYVLLFIIRMEQQSGKFVKEWTLRETLCLV